MTVLENIAILVAMYMVLLLIIHLMDKEDQKKIRRARYRRRTRYNR